MKSITTLIGLALVIAGIAAIGYQGFTYTKRESIAQIGDLKVTADTQQTVAFSPVVGGIAIIAGIALVAISRRK